LPRFVRQALKDGVAMQDAKGAPMGADLPAAKSSKAPTFAVWAVKDPKSSNLDRIQSRSALYCEILLMFASASLGVDPSSRAADAPSGPPLRSSKTR
jgi:hypothetical protein